MVNEMTSYGSNAEQDKSLYPSRRSLRNQAKAAASSTAQTTRAAEMQGAVVDATVDLASSRAQMTNDDVPGPVTRRSLRQQAAIVHVSRRSLRKQAQDEVIDRAPLQETTRETPTTKRDLLHDLPVVTRSTLEVALDADDKDNVLVNLTPSVTHKRATKHHVTRKVRGGRAKRRQSAFERQIAQTQSIQIQPMPSLVTVDPNATSGKKPKKARWHRRALVFFVSAGIVFTGAVPAYAVDPVVVAHMKPGATVDQTILAAQAAEGSRSSSAQSVSVDGTDFAEDSDPTDDYERDSADANGPVDLNEPRVNVACKVSDISGDDVDASVVIPVPVGSFDLTSAVGGRWGRWHNGQDFAAHLGTSIVAAQSGTVVGVGFWGSNPYIAILNDKMSDGKQYGTVYEHMPPSSIRVKVGDKVRAGEQIALVGNEGQSTGPHLHFEVHDVTGHAADKFLGVKTHIQPVAWLKQYSAVGLNGC